MWYWWAASSIAIIVYFWTYHFRAQKIFAKFFIVSCAILFSSFLFAIYPVQPLALFQVALVFLLSLAIILSIKKSNKNRLVYGIFFIGFCALYAQWGIAQFVIQHDLGLVKIGESVINQNTPGVASFYIASEKHIRAYGPFGHANSFAGVLLLGIIVLYRLRENLQSKLFTQSIFFLLSLGIATSFSRTALLGLGFIGALYAFKRKAAILAPVVITCVLFSGLLFHRSTDIRDMAAHDRLMGLSWYADMIDNKTIVRGIGLGNYTTVLANYLLNNNIKHNPWDIAPIHSVPLLLLAELGIIICVALCILVIRPGFTKKYWIYIALMPTLVFDHYAATQLAPAIFLIISTKLVVY